MEIDLDRLLRRVVDDAALGDEINAVYSHDPKRRHTSRVELSTPRGDRHAWLRATYEWFELTIPDLGVEATLFEYDENEADKERVLRELALVAGAYLRGEGNIGYKRGVLGSRPVLSITVNGREWRLGRRLSQVHYPSDASPEAHEGA